jgi:hypothetical protein
MAKKDEKKTKPKPPADVATVIAIKKTLDDRKAKQAKARAAATKDGKLNKYEPKYRHEQKLLKRAQRRLSKEAWRLRGLKQAAPAEAAAPAAPAEAAPAAPAAS